jgi:hypothetical protein
MKSKKHPKVLRKDRAWQNKIEKLVKAEKLELSHPKGKERFDQALLNLLKKPKP